MTLLPRVFVAVGTQNGAIVMNTRMIALCLCVIRVALMIMTVDKNEQMEREMK